ncbi:MAG TPA: copper-binding protein, partial [Geobacteraceae bacterium]
VAGAAIAEDKKPAAAPAAKEAAPKADAAKAKAPKGAKPRVITGMVEAVDAAAGTVTVKGRKEAVSLKAAEGLKLDDVKAGDKVTVTFKGDALSKIVKAKGGKGAACCPGCTCKDCKDCPKGKACKDCPKCKDCKDAKSCKDCPKAEKKAMKGAKGKAACENCPQAEAPAK